MTAHQKKSVVLTIVLHGIIALLLWFLNLSTPNPPFAEGLAGGGGGGSFVEFGTLDISDVDPTPAPSLNPKKKS
jgi:hypothetical protein